MDNLITQYLDLYPSKAAALRSLNLNTGLEVQQNRLYEWLDGKHLPPREAINHMIQAVTKRDDILIP